GGWRGWGDCGRAGGIKVHLPGSPVGGRELGGGDRAGGRLQGVIRNLRTAAAAGGIGGLTDGQLLERFVTRRDEGSFELLVWRHGAMVLATCRRVLADPADAEDAFQAAFLVFLRRAATIRR